jgi:transcriptional regulator with XRE-family HTH domain
VTEQSSDRRRQIGRRIREWRLRRDLSQAEVARVAGITQASLSNYETGKRDLPLSTFLGVARALDVGVGDLIETDDVVIVRDSRLSRAVDRLVRHPELVEIVAPETSAMDAVAS